MLNLQALQDEVAERSTRFRTFDNPLEHQRYMALALAGEVGEFLNLVKKEWRGDPNLGLAHQTKKLDEASDIFIYWLLLCHAHGWGIEAVMRHANAKAQRKIEALEAERRQS